MKKSNKEIHQPVQPVSLNPKEPNYVNSELYMEVGHGYVPTYAFISSLLKNEKKLFDNGVAQKFLEVLNDLDIKGVEVLILRQHFSSDQSFVTSVTGYNFIEKAKSLAIQYFSDYGDYTKAIEDKNSQERIEAICKYPHLKVLLMVIDA